MATHTDHMSNGHQTDNVAHSLKAGQHQSVNYNVTNNFSCYLVKGSPNFLKLLTNLLISASVNPFTASLLTVRGLPLRLGLSSSSSSSLPSDSSTSRFFRFFFSPSESYSICSCNSQRNDLGQHLIKVSMSSTNQTSSSLFLFHKYPQQRDRNLDEPPSLSNGKVTEVVKFLPFLGDTKTSISYHCNKAGHCITVINNHDVKDGTMMV